MFIVALFTLAKTWKQPNCPSTNEWIKSMCQVYTEWNIFNQKEKKKEGNPPLAATWMNFEGIRLSERGRQRKINTA